MGRVARYKKVKKSLSTASGADYFDTVGVWGLGESGRKVKKRSQTVLKLRAQRKNSSAAVDSNAFDAAPDGDNDFDLADLVGSLKRDANPSLEASATSASTSSHAASTTTTVAAASCKAPAVASSTIDADEEKLLKKFEKQVEPQKQIVAAEGRMQGESKRAYNKRVKQETRQIIQRANKQEHNPEKRQKKKDFLNQKKKRGKRKASAYNNNSDSDDNGNEHDEDDVDDDAPVGKLLTGEQAVAARDRETQVRFGEQAERPPVFKQLPRGAAKKSVATASSAKKHKSTSLLNPAEMEAEQHAMDLLRRKVQAQYAAIKAQRKLNGDFHL